MAKAPRTGGANTRLQGLADCYPRGAVAWRPRLEKECTVTGLHSDAQRQSRHFFQNDPPMASDLDPG